MRFTLTKNLILQAAAVAGVTQIDRVAEDAEKWAMIAITLAQAVIAIVAHFKRPSGGPINTK